MPAEPDGPGWGKSPPPRDLVGYGGEPPDPRWPGGAHVAVQFVLNYEEGAERSVLDGDEGSETFLSEMIGAESFPMRHMSMESLYEYGSRAGFWRVLRLFDDTTTPLTIFAVARALQRNPRAAAAMVAGGHEVAGHGLRWLSYQRADPVREAADLAEAVELLRALTGSAPVGWYTGRDSHNTRSLVVAHGGFLYDADSYGDDLPYWSEVNGRSHLIVPYTMDTNDMRFATPGGFSTGAEFESYVCDAFDALLEEGRRGQPKMLSVGLHGRIIGRPGRFAGLVRVLEHMRAQPDVWFASRADIARHWIIEHPFAPE
jgi:allantoinase